MDRYSIAVGSGCDTALAEIECRRGKYIYAGPDGMVQARDTERRVVIAGARFPKVLLSDLFWEICDWDLARELSMLNSQRMEALRVGAEVARPYLEGPPLGEAKLWAAVEENQYRFAGNELARVEFLRMLQPHLRRNTAKNLLGHVLGELRRRNNLQAGAEEQGAMVVVEELSKWSSAEVEPGPEEMSIINECRRLQMFDAIYAVHGIVGRNHASDIAVLGAIRRGGSDKVPDMPASFPFAKGLVPDCRDLTLGALFRIATFKSIKEKEGHDAKE